MGNEITFNGVHLAITLGALAIGLALGAIYGYLARGEKGGAE